MCTENARIFASQTFFLAQKFIEINFGCRHARHTPLIIIIMIFVRDLWTRYIYECDIFVLVTKLQVWVLDYGRRQPPSAVNVIRYHIENSTWRLCELRRHFIYTVGALIVTKSETTNRRISTKWYKQLEGLMFGGDGDSALKKSSTGLKCFQTILGCEMEILIFDWKAFAILRSKRKFVTCTSQPSHTSVWMNECVFIPFIADRTDNETNRWFFLLFGFSIVLELVFVMLDARGRRRRRRRRIHVTSNFCGQTECRFIFPFACALAWQYFCPWYVVMRYRLSDTICTFLTLHRQMDSTKRSFESHWHSVVTVKVYEIHFDFFLLIRNRSFDTAQSNILFRKKKNDMRIVILFAFAHMYIRNRASHGTP